MDLLDAVNEVSNEILEGYHVTAPAFNILELQSEHTKSWIDAFIKEYNRQPLYTEAYAYDAMIALIEAICIVSQENCSLDSALHQVDIEGVTGHLTFSRNGEIEDNLHVGIFRSGILYVD